LLQLIISYCPLQVHRSVQILRDKQELAETQKELAKLQLAQKESSSSSHSQSNEEKTSAAAADSRKTDNTSDVHNQQLALALPHQVAPQPQPVAPPSQAPPQNLTQQPSYYLPSTQLPNPPAQTQHTQSQYPPSDSQYRTPQLQDISRAGPQPTPSQVNQTPQVQSFPQYQQQWPQQSSQPQQQPLMQPQIRPLPATVYSSYPPSQQTNPSPPETLPNSMPMQVPFPGIPQPVSSRADAMPYGYGGTGRTVPQQPPQQMKSTFGAPPGDGYAAAGPQPTLPPGNAYMMYDGEGRAHHPPQPSHYTQGGYPPTSVSLQNPQQQTTGPNLMVRNPSHSQFFRNHPYAELIEKLSSMGFRGDHAASVIQRMEESGQPVDFNTVIDMLNAHSSGGSQRGW
jgi:hypothetical protein